MEKNNNNSSNFLVFGRRQKKKKNCEQECELILPSLIAQKLPVAKKPDCFLERLALSLYRTEFVARPSTDSLKNYTRVFFGDKLPIFEQDATRQLEPVNQAAQGQK